MPDVAVVTGPVFEEHRPPDYHPERPERVRVIREEASRLARDGLIELLEPVSVPLSEAARVHEEGYVEYVKAAVEEAPRYLDPDTYVSPGTLDAALAALGSVYRAAELVYEKRFRVVYAAVRPPGHHAGPDRAAGFCIFNNVAYAAQRLIDDRGAERIAILDIDAHWGDGTAEIFYDRRDVLYISFHQDPRTLYPGRGFPEELGRGEGRGYTVNIIMPPFATDAMYAEAWEEIAEPILHAYSPEVILVSLGFDAHRDDPLTDLALTLQGYWWVLRQALRVAEEVTGRGLAIALEGGYDLRVLREGVHAVAGLTGDKPPVWEEPGVEPGEARGRFRRFLERVRKALEPYWPVLRR